MGYRFAGLSVGVRWQINLWFVKFFRKWIELNDFAVPPNNDRRVVLAGALGFLLAQ